jgi:peptidoglycan/LPS O-acetylase OafA/YrhL
VQFFGYAGVDLFFVLSGFIITWAHVDRLGHPRALLGYAARRLWRIYPAYWVCWLGATLPRLLRPGAAPSLNETVTCLFLWPQAGGDLFPQASLQAANVPIPQSWTLVYELLFYLLFACFFLLPRRFFLPLLAGWFLATACAASFGLGFLAALPLQPLVLEFLLGCFAALALHRQVRIPAAACLVLGALWFAVGAWLHSAGLTPGPLDPRQRVLAFGVPAALLVLGSGARERAGCATLPRWLRPLGDASYSIYLTHVVVLSTVCKLTAGPGPRLLPHLAWLGLLITAALVAGWIFHLLIERPLLRWRRRPALPPAPAPLPGLPTAA